MSVVLQEVGHQLVGNLRRLKQQHSAGITPTFGQVEELFDLGEQLDVAIRLSEPALPCSIDTCRRAAATKVHSRPYCERCARALQAVTTQVAQDAPEIARARLEAMVRGRAPWPASAAAGELA